MAYGKGKGMKGGKGKGHNTKTGKYCS